MEQEEQQSSPVFDFLYKDPDRIMSYYAQIFAGALTSLEETSSTAGTKKRTAGLKAVVEGSAETEDSHTSSARRIVSPHDVITTDVLSRLLQMCVSENYQEADSGTLVLALGTVHFVDKSMVDMAIASLDALIRAERQKPVRERNSGIQSISPAIVKIYGNGQASVVNLSDNCRWSSACRNY